MTTHYIRVKNKTTKHEFDLPVESFDPEKYSRVDSKRYPPTTRPRRPKPHVPMGGRRTVPVNPDKE